MISSPLPVESAEAVSADLLARTLGEWRRLGVRWAPLREAAPEEVGDLDLLVHPGDLTKARETGLAQGLVLLPGRHRGTHLLGYDESAGRWVWLHCVTELSYGPWAAVRTAAAEAVLSRRDPRALQLEPSDKFWATLLHCLLDREAISQRHRDGLRAGAARADSSGPIAEALAPWLPAGWSPAEIVAAARLGDWPRLEMLGATLRAACRRAAPSLPRRLAGALSRLPGRLRERWDRRGVRVALLGPDGAGKSTLAGGLERSFPFPLRQVYMGLTGGWLRRVDKLRIPGVVRIGRLLVIWGRFVRGLALAARGRLVIFDRYVYDSEVPTPYHLGPAGRVARWMDGRACPGPDVTILLDAPGEVMYRRKGEYDAATLEQWRQGFLALRRRVPDLEVVDATRPPETVLRDVSARIWRRYATRWGGT